MEFPSRIILRSPCCAAPSPPSLPPRSCGVLQLDGHAGVEEETEQEVQDGMAGHREMSPDLRPHQSHLANEDEVEDPTKDVGPVHCEL